MGIKGRKKKASRHLAATSPAGTAERFPKHVVVAFLEELHRAHQYFLFKEYLRLDCAHLIQGYVLDESLEVELEKLRTFAPTYYRDCLDGWKPPGKVEAGTVTVSNISLNVSEIDIRKFFGTHDDIKYVRTRSTPRGQIAYITYKDIYRANEIQCYTGMKRPHLSMYIQSPCYSGYAPLVVQPISDEDARYVDEKAEDDLRSKHVEAHYKYSELKTYYSQLSQSQSKDVDVDVCKKEERWGTCPWMVMEARANGGYTVGGQCLEAFYTVGWQTSEVLENEV